MEGKEIILVNAAELILNIQQRKKEEQVNRREMKYMKGRKMQQSEKKTQKRERGRKCRWRRRNVKAKKRKAIQQQERKSDRKSRWRDVRTIKMGSISL